MTKPLLAIALPLIPFAQPSGNGQEKNLRWQRPPQPQARSCNEAANQIKRRHVVAGKGETQTTVWRPVPFDLVFALRTGRVRWAKVSVNG
jgi:hypothetical protein